MTVPSAEDKKAKTRTEKLRFARLRFVSAELTTTPDARARARVTLADGPEEFTGEVEGVGGDVVELRLAAEAAIQALHTATDTAGILQLVGVKIVNAFDGKVVLVCITSSLRPKAKLLGAVPVTEEPEEGVAIAILDATNRLLEKPDAMRSEETERGAEDS